MNPTIYRSGLARSVAALFSALAFVGLASLSSAQTFSATAANPDGCFIGEFAGHALFLPNLDTRVPLVNFGVDHNDGSLFTFAPTPGTFVENPDGSASLTGTIKSQLRPGFDFNVSVTFPPGSRMSSGTPFVSGELSCPVDPSTWHFYSTYVATLTGINKYAGAQLTLTPTMPPNPMASHMFQVGPGATNKNLLPGASGWFYFAVNHQPSDGSFLRNSADFGPAFFGDFDFNIFGPCPQCVDPNLGLGAAAGCTVLQLSNSKVDITGPAGGLKGDVCIAPGGQLSMSGDEFITGIVKLGTGATFNNSSHSSPTVMTNVDLSAQIAAANSRASSAAALAPNQTFTKLDGSTATINGVAGINVIKVGDIQLSGKQITLTGPPGTQFILNISGKIAMTGGGNGPQIRAGGSVQPKDILYNVIGSGEDVQMNGGGGGVNCCAAIIDGTLLAPMRKIALAPGQVNGEIISGKDISIVSGSSVRCPTCP